MHDGGRAGTVGPMTFDPDQSLIEYPCSWEYRIIGTAEADIRRAVAVVVDGEHSLRRANQKGKFLSMSLELVVADQETRDSIHSRLGAQPGIRMVM